MTYHCKAFGFAAVLALSPMVAPAATVDITFQSFGSGNSVDKAGAIAAQNAFMGSSSIIGAEDFENFTACPDTSCASANDTTAIASTQVGDFYRFGSATGSGNAQLDPKDDIVVRMDNPNNTFSRFDVVGGAKWLDSNDHVGIRWEIPGASSGLSDIRKIAFFLTDVDDVRGFAFSFDVSQDTLDTVNMIGKPHNNRPDGELQLVTMLFDAPVNLISIEMRSGTNDGFGIDGIQVGTVPLPASALLLLGGLGGLGGLSALRRRKRVA